ncbi:hypothetical protein HYU20_01840 [Candidatus Woesearchaeota archaeon]|nr:hypothetical protein [Candidatus Woesearchaeota archaeon]
MKARIKGRYWKGYRQSPGRLAGSLKSGLMKSLNAKIAEVVRAAAGEDAIKLVKIMASCRNVSEFRIVKSARLDIQKVRNLLYKLHSSNLADYKRVKDNKKGIYVSYWTFNRAMVEELFSKLHQEKLQRFRERLEVETGNVNGFFICPAACTRADFARAEQQRFRCEECGQLLAQEDNTRTIDFLREKVREMEAVVA